MNEKDQARILAEMIREELRKIDPDFDSGFHFNLATSRWRIHMVGVRR